MFFPLNSRSSLWLIFVSILSGPSISARTNPLTQIESQCRIEVLKKLGWQINTNASLRDYETEHSDRCVEKAPVLHGAQDILLSNETYQNLLNRKGTICSFKRQVGRAALASVQALTANRELTFWASRKLFLKIPPDAPWDATCPQSYCMRPRDSISTALNYLFQKGKMGLECAAGLQVAKYGILRELYRTGDGTDLLDQFFNKDEFLVGEWDEVRNSTSVVFGTRVSKPVDYFGTLALQMGRPGLLGVAGYLGNARGESFLDSVSDRGENFMIVDVSESAYQVLKSNFGMKYVNHLAREVWDYSQQGNVLETARVLQDPALVGVKVFVHPLGVMSLSEHLSRLLRVNPRTYYEIRLYPDSVNGDLLTNYSNDVLSYCVKTRSK